MRKIEKVYPVLSMLSIHIKQGDAKERFLALSNMGARMMIKELKLLSENAINPDQSYMKDRMLFFEIAAFLFSLQPSAEDLQSAVEGVM